MRRTGCTGGAPSTPGATARSTRFTPANAHELRLVWSWALAEGSQQTTPLVYDGVHVHREPRASGCRPSTPAPASCCGSTGARGRRPTRAAPPPNLQHRNLAIYQDKIYLNTSDGHVVALDARTGDEVWDADVGGAAGYEYTSGVDHRRRQGGLRPHRPASAIATTRATSWRSTPTRAASCGAPSTVARPGERGGDSWGDLPVMFRAGSDAWIPGSYDPRAQTLFFGTAQAKPWGRAVRGTDGSALYTQLDAGPRSADRRAEVVLPAPAGRVARHGRGVRAHPRRLRRPAVGLHHGQDRRAVGARPRDRPVPRRARPRLPDAGRHRPRDRRGRLPRRHDPGHRRGDLLVPEHLGLQELARHVVQPPSPRPSTSR